MNSPNFATGIELKPIGQGFGCEVIGLDLSAPLPESDFARIRQAWYDHSFLVFRDLGMNPEQHIAFTRRLGPLHIMEREFNLPDHPEVMVIAKEERDGKPYGSRRVGLGWHSDGEDKRIPNAGSLLYGLTIPPEGGDTMFADMYAAYAALPQRLKRAIQGRRARFSRIDMHHVHYPDLPALTEAQKRDRPDVFHPLVRQHPRTGRSSLFVGRWARDVEGKPSEEGRVLMEELFAFAQNEAFTYRHRWRQNDAVLWDNRCMLHRAMGYDEERYVRHMHRTTIEGDVPRMAAPE
ncbi:MAG: TauD/TfdA family dioxygenase [Acetobacteraceae bacterium]|nr:TauD/TfdA family dioxygenase [Acetobacteraceae bacterium]